MGYMTEITENKFDELAENIEELIRIGGKTMSCIDKMRRGRMGERMPDYRDRNRYDDYDDDDYEGRYGERRGGYRGDGRRY
mgnify:CR=1 FL=1